MNEGNLQIEPLAADTLGPASLTLHLGGDCQILKSRGPILVDRAETYPELEPRAPDRDGYVSLRPGEVLLAASLEAVSLGKGYCGWLSGTSDLARLGVQVVISHLVAPGFGMGDPSALILELVSLAGAEIRLLPGMRVGHLVVARLGQAVALGYEATPHGYSGLRVMSSNLHRRSGSQEEDL